MGILAAFALLQPGSLALPAEITEAIDLYKSGKYLECAELAGKAIEEGQYSETWRILKIEAELASGRYLEALATLDEALERFSTSIRLRWLGHKVCLLNDRGERAAELLGQIDVLTGGASWRYSDPASRVTMGRFSLLRGVDPKRVLDEIYGRVKQRVPNDAQAYVASGELALDKQDYQLAAEEFEKAAKLDATDPAIHYGLARALAPSEAERSQAALDAALQRNPNHVDSLLFLVENHIDAERYAEAEQLLLRIFQINVLEPRAWAYRAVLAHLNSDATEEELCRGMACGWWRGNPEVDYLIGKKLSQKYRFAEGATYQRRSLELDSGYLPARMQLSQDLLRLGQEAEGWRLAEEVYDKDGYNVVAHNLATLRDHLTGFRTLRGEGLVVRMEAREAEIYGPRVLDLLRRAKEQLCAKYDVQIDGPVTVEIFPQQSDFAIRTFGLPGGDGFLGVCFGRVITANSPASQGENPSNWESVLWHEFCHVVTLEKTRNKMPRWLSEGISVYEERQADPTWGQSMTPRYREMILGDDLTPVSRLSGAFLRPPSPVHLQLAYYESALVVEYLVEQYGLDTLKRILDDLGAGMPINESLRRSTGSLEALDRQFADFARRRAAQLAPGMDWEKPELSPRADSRALAEWNQANPSNYWGLRRYAAQLIKEKKWQEAKSPLGKILELYPEDHGPDNAYAMLAAVHRQLGETSEERAVLEKFVAQSAAAVDALLRLAEISAAAEDWEKAAACADRILAVSPLQPAPQRLMATAAERTGDHERAIGSLEALLTMDPLDPADIHYRLATLLHRKGDVRSARVHVLKALEEAPRFRAAHRQLLEIIRDMEENHGRETNINSP